MSDKGSGSGSLGSGSKDSKIDPLDVNKEGDLVEVHARDLMDVEFKYTWRIGDYLKDIEEGHNVDSAPFFIKVNGLTTKWNMALRFWTSEDGKRLTNPVVVCLNLISAATSNENLGGETVRIRYNFGVWNDIVKQYEVSPGGQQKVTLSNVPRDQQSLQSIAVRDVLILDRHLIDGKNIEIICKIFLVRDKVEQHTLALDLWNKLVSADKTDFILRSLDGDAFPVHQLVLSSRSTILGQMMDRAKATVNGHGVIQLEASTSILTSLLQYIYTDRVDPLEAPQSLIRLADQLELPGLKSICERALVESIIPGNVAGLLLIADNFNCEILKNACMGYVEDNPQAIVKSVAWKFMEKVNPGLFEEVCQL